MTINKLFFYFCSASHCVNGKDIPNTWTLTAVRLGEWDTTSTVDCDDSFVEEKVCSDPAVDILIESAISHHNYDPYSLSQHNDIALLRLASDVEYSHYIKPICLQADKNSRDLSYDRHTLTVSGWGKTEDGFASARKLKVNVDGVSRNDCQNMYNLENVEVVSSQICAGGQNGQDSW